MSTIQCDYTEPDSDQCADAAEFVADPDDSRMYLCGQHLLIVMDQPGERYLIEVLDQAEEYR